MEILSEYNRLHFLSARKLPNSTVVFLVVCPQVTGRNLLLRVALLARSFSAASSISDELVMDE